MASFFTKALRSAGKVVTYPTRKVGLTNKNLAKVGNKLKKVPVVGVGLAATYNTAVAAPIRFSNQVAKSGRIDRAVYQDLKAQVKGAQDLAPVAATIASFFPGVGTGIAGAIGAANALSKGQGISGAFKEGAKAATPGGYLAQAAYNSYKDIAAGKKLSKVQYDTLSRDGVDVSRLQVDAKAAINGDTKAMARLDSQLKILPPDVRRGAMNGLTVGYAEKLQKAHVKGAKSKTSKRKVYAKGKAAIRSNPILRAVSNRKLRRLQAGFPYGVGAMRYKQTPAALSTLRKSLAAKYRLGFDAGVAAHIGMTSRKAPPGGGSPLQLLGYYITEGLRGSSARGKKRILQILASIPESRSGVRVVARDVVKQRRVTTTKKNWWDKLVDWLGI